MEHQASPSGHPNHTPRTRTAAWLCLQSRQQALGLLLFVFGALVHCTAPAMAEATTSASRGQGKAYEKLPYQMLDQGYCPSNLLPEAPVETTQVTVEVDGKPQTQTVPAGPPPYTRVLVLRTTEEFENFWSVSHIGRVSRVEKLLNPNAWKRPPKIDFKKRCVVVAGGRPGGAQTRVQAIFRSKDRVSVKTSSIVWPDLAAPKGKVAFVSVVCPRLEGVPKVKDDPAALAFNALVTHIPTWQYDYYGQRRDLEESQLKTMRRQLHHEGDLFLVELWRLQTRYNKGPHIPFTKLLEARVLEETTGRREQARGRYRDLCHRYPDSLTARFAQHCLDLLRRVDLDAVSLDELDKLRAQLEKDTEGAEGSGRAWLDLGGQYEYLLATRPDTLFTAARCYLRGAKDTSDPVVTQNCYLRAAAVFGTYLNRKRAVDAYLVFLDRYPDSDAVVGALQKLDELLVALGRGQHGDAYRRFLDQHPSSKKTSKVSKLLH